MGVNLDRLSRLVLLAAVTFLVLSALLVVGPLVVFGLRAGLFDGEANARIPNFRLGVMVDGRHTSGGIIEVPADNPVVTPTVTKVMADFPDQRVNVRMKQVRPQSTGQDKPAFEPYPADGETLTPGEAITLNSEAGGYYVIEAMAFDSAGMGIHPPQTMVLIVYEYPEGMQEVGGHGIGRGRPPAPD